jgi:hypothetical protein
VGSSADGIAYPSLIRGTRSTTRTRPILGRGSKAVHEGALTLVKWVGILLAVLIAAAVLIVVVGFYRGLL